MGFLDIKPIFGRFATGGPVKFVHPLRAIIPNTRALFLSRRNQHRQNGKRVLPDTRARYSYPFLSRCVIPYRAPLSSTLGVRIRGRGAILRVYLRLRGRVWFWLLWNPNGFWGFLSIRSGYPVAICIYIYLSELKKILERRRGWRLIWWLSTQVVHRSFVRRIAWSKESRLWF